MDHDVPTPTAAIVVGIDGSNDALHAALWAVAEAADRDLPVRLVYAVERPRGADPVTSRSAAHDFATAEIAVRRAVVAVESAQQPVQIEAEIAYGRAADVLLAASRAATMICVGALGVERAIGHRVGSTGAELAARARCPVAIIRRPHPAAWAPGCIVVEFDESPDATAILDCAVDEAALRGAPLRVLTASRPHVERLLDRCRRRQSEVEVTTVPHCEPLANYVARQPESIQLVVTGAAHADVHHASSTLTCPHHGAL